MNAVCEFCEKEYKQTRLNRKYCSDRCRISYNNHWLTTLSIEQRAELTALRNKFIRANKEKESLKNGTNNN